MSPQDRPHVPLPARQAELVPAPHPRPLPAEIPHNDDLPTGKKVTAKLVARAVRRHWWQAAVVWIIGSIGLMALAYFKVKPTYIGYARVRVEPGEMLIFTQTRSSSTELGNYLETQVSTLTNPTVIQAALAAHPEILYYPRFRDSADPVADIKTLVIAGVVPKTNLIDVIVTTQDGMEAATIVNAVVNAYLRSTQDISSVETEQKIKRFREAMEDKHRQVETKRGELRLSAQKAGAIDEEAVKRGATVTIDEYKRISEKLSAIQIEIIKAQSRFDQLQNELPSPVAAEAPSPENDKDTFNRLLRSHPEIAELSARWRTADQTYKKISDKTRDALDPAVVQAKSNLRQIKADLDEAYARIKPEIEAQVRRGAGIPGGVGEGQDAIAARQADRELAAMRVEEGLLTSKLNALTIQKNSNNAEALGLEFDRMDLQRAEHDYDLIRTNLQQIEFENKSPLARVRGDFFARPSGIPSTTSRLKVMAMAPVGVLVGILGLLVLLELHAGRVVDPEELPGRIRVPVIGVVPPLPQIRAASAAFSAREEFKAQRQLDQFVQSLDHLRVALCSGRNAFGREQRCILITSACGSEGKTTLAAQLAERCVNAGLNTLLIDGDLRNPTLSRMLDVPTGRGLINVLRGEATAEEATVVVGGAGGFHFMPSGTPKVDPSRLLHGDRLGKVLAHAREMFDIVIVDAPPVLPVPDALTIGRWTDGAVLAVRYDMSRFPLVEKANRRLASVGVPVIGAVVNGVRVADATYGSYYPSYAYSNEQASQAPLDV